MSRRREELSSSFARAAGDFDGVEGASVFLRWRRSDMARRNWGWGIGGEELEGRRERFKEEKTGGCLL